MWSKGAISLNVDINLIAIDYVFFSLIATFIKSFDVALNMKGDLVGIFFIVVIFMISYSMPKRWVAKEK